MVKLILTLLKWPINNCLQHLLCVTDQLNLNPSDLAFSVALYQYVPSYIVRFIKSFVSLSYTSTIIYNEASLPIYEINYLFDMVKLMDCTN
jgi:hypothetical protein